ncbi:hypothetical protein NP233_g11892 [Leucocoprinus birnbaumii]|uniref:DUF6697 domain-containing protein n=1 Tax=Leucocoprinus birnbaumii TaxID=56174 RepID=A0AAD5VGL7_9AGAR|nr:hypothetical protein NP233_g11892 [Leucocoprinus birnbaumii]
MHPNADHHPLVPHNPGYPGLIICNRLEVSEGVWSLLIHSGNRGTPVQWIYAGQYENRLVGEMEPEDFKNQRDLLKKAWVERIWRLKNHPRFSEMRARISLRKQGKVLTDENVQTEKQRSDITSIIAPDDIILALENGEEKLMMFTLLCVGYDHSLARELEYESKKWKSKNTFIPGDGATPIDRTRKRKRTTRGA